jgi:hypothetical protein
MTPLPRLELRGTNYTRMQHLVGHLHDIHNYARQHLKLASDRMNPCNNLANSAGYQEGDRVGLYRPSRTKGKSPNISPRGRPIRGSDADK